ncbi:MAG TPA: VCBS repeat-containing protein [Ignavibacteria bacterium]|nr:VCBS repeat-containing protein [Ignavibacteria bacterium]
MKKLLAVVLLVLASSAFLNAKEDGSKRSFTKKEIVRLADAYIKNNVSVNNPVITDIDKDGDFDILDFTNKGNVIYYKNKGSLENPFFILENKKFDNYEMNSFLPNGIPIPVFFADRDGDGDSDMFGIVKSNSEYKAAYAENAFDISDGTLITIILVLVIIVLVIAIV